jgi:peptidyl-prolyl cis-trans isomerase SurA
MMRGATQHGAVRGGKLLLLAAMLVAPVWAQNPTPMPVAPSAAVPPMPAAAPSATQSEAPTAAAPTKIVLPTLPRSPVVQGAEIDRVVAIVNNDLILDSDVDQERRFAALLPYGEASGPYTRDAAIERLINRELILQQARLQPGDEITLDAAEKDLNSLRSSIPQCKEYHCETTEGCLGNLWRQRMVVLAFIEQRFRMGVKISPEEIQTYYEKTMLPQYAAQHATAPPIDAISSRIQEVLLQKQVSSLLSDWLNSLRAQGNVVVLHPGEEAP